MPLQERVSSGAASRKSNWRPPKTVDYFVIEDAAVLNYYFDV